MLRNGTGAGGGRLGGEEEGAAAAERQCAEPWVALEEIGAGAGASLPMLLLLLLLLLLLMMMMMMEVLATGTMPVAQLQRLADSSRDECWRLVAIHPCSASLQRGASTPGCCVQLPRPWLPAALQHWLQPSNVAVGPLRRLLLLCQISAVLQQQQQREHVSRT